MSVRQAILYVIEENDFLLLPSTKKNLRGWCGVASVILAKELKEVGINATVWEGEYSGMPHTWIIVNNYIVDITATQFGLEEVYITKAYNKGCKYWPIDKLEPTYEAFEGWFENERPSEVLCQRIRNAIRDRRGREIQEDIS